jgi:hypothetical protein
MSDSEHETNCAMRYNLTATHRILCPVLGRQNPPPHNLSMGQVPSDCRVPSNDGGVFDHETLELLRACLDDAWAQLSPIQQSNTLKSTLALRILQAAAAGERDPVRLRTCALLHIASPPRRMTAQRPEYSYRVLKKDETEWSWDLCDPDGQVVARGGAETRAKAVAHAMVAGLKIVDTQGSSKDDNTGSVPH